VIGIVNVDLAQDQPGIVIGGRTFRAATKKTLCENLPLYVRYGVDSAEAVELISSGLRSRAFAHRVAVRARGREFPGGGLREWLQSLPMDRWRAMFAGTPADFLDLLEFTRTRGRGLLGALLSDEHAEVQAELEERTANGTVAIQPIETDRPPQRFGVYRDAHPADRHARLLAGPGTGKSATVVALLTKLLDAEQRPRVRLLTFTRAATAELAHKVAEHPEAAVDRPSTIHSFAISVLLANPGSADFPTPLRIADDWEMRTIIEPQLAAMSGVTPTVVRRKLIPEMAANWESLEPHHRADVDEQTRNRFLGAWDQHRRVYGYTLLPELPDLLRRALESHDDLQGLDFDMLVVDEYQDLNACDLRVLRLLADKGTAVFGVGDDSRSTRSDGPPPKGSGASTPTTRTRPTTS
jgi:hypothetical protein